MKNENYLLNLHKIIPLWYEDVHHSLRQCLERSNRYILLVDWESLEAHKIGFRTSDAYLEWKRLLHHYYDPFPTVEHYKTIF